MPSRPRATYAPGPRVMATPRPAPALGARPRSSPAASARLAGARDGPARVSQPSAGGAARPAGGGVGRTWLPASSTSGAVGALKFKWSERDAACAHAGAWAGSGGSGSAGLGGCDSCCRMRALRAPWSRMLGGLALRCSARGTAASPHGPPLGPGPSQSPPALASLPLSPERTPPATRSCC